MIYLSINKSVESWDNFAKLGSNVPGAGTSGNIANKLFPPSP